MKTLVINPWSEQLEKNLLTFPDFLFHRLARNGIGRVEAEPKRGESEVRWHYVSRLTGQRSDLASTPAVDFRTCLARLAHLVDINPYGDHVTIAIDAHPGWPVARTHRYSIFLCNEPTMDIWVKIYLYCIDGEWPMKGSTYLG